MSRQNFIQWKFSYIYEIVCIVTISYIIIDAEYSNFHVDVDMTKNIIRCVPESYAAENNLSCIIQAIFELKQGNCSCSYQVESPNYVYEVSSIVGISHLPRNQIFCFIAEANCKNLTSTVILTGSFSTSTGCNHVPSFTQLKLPCFVCCRSY